MLYKTSNLSGNWKPQKKCPPNSAICGMRVQMAQSRGSKGDDTGITGIEVKCCRLGIPKDWPNQ